MAASGSTEIGQASGKQVKIQLTTKQSNIALPEDNGPILVDTNLRRYALSVLVNHLLGHTEKSQRIPFDFLINGTILKTSLEEFLTANGISAETVLHAEYIPAFVPPKHAASFEHDAWVSSIDVLSASDSKLSQSMVLSGSYDGLIRVWNTSSQVIATSTYLGDSRFVAATKAARFVSSTRIASAGMDRTVHLWKFQEPSSVAGEDASIKHEADLHHHNQMVLSLDARNSEQRLLSASADHTIALWNTDPKTAPTYTPEATSTPANKKQKKSSIAQIAPLSTLKGHTHHVTGVLFSPHAPEQAYSISSDNTLKTWSLATTSVLDNRPLPDPLYSISTLSNMHLLAVGSSKGDITLLDPRASTAAVKVSTIRQAHSNGFVSSLSNDSTSQYRFASGGFDGMVKVWDVRSLTGSAMVIDRKSDGGKGGKVFSVKWAPDVGILSGGEDAKVRIDR